jgi:glucokinase
MKEGDEARRTSLRAAIGADVGASRLKLALVDHAGRVLRSSEQPTPRTGTGVQIAAEIADSIAAFSADTPGGVESVGVGVLMPHFVEGPEFIQRWPNNLPALEGVAMRPLLRARLGERVAMANDVSAAAVAEHMFGVGRGIDRLVVVSIGTGISIGVVIEGELLQYTWGTAGDTGHVIVDTGGRLPCTCGARGCLETVASGLGIRAAALRALESGEGGALRAVAEHDPHFGAADVADAARQGDSVARRIFEQMGFYIGVAVASYAQLFFPELVVLAGGLTGASDLWLDEARGTLRQLASPLRLPTLKGIELSAFPRSGAAIGAAGLVLHPREYVRSCDARDTEVV